MMSLSKSQTLSPSTVLEKKKVLLRSTCSFSIVEENIVAPTPTRKLASVPSSPVQKRRDRKPAQESLFGEAGEEIQTILFHSLEEVSLKDSTLTEEDLPPRATVGPKRLDFQTPQLTFSFPSPIQQEDQRGIFVRPGVHVPPVLSMMDTLEMPSPPLRSSNPITMNSPFIYNPEKQGFAATTAAIHQEMAKPFNIDAAWRKSRQAARQAKEIRERSASWPAPLNKLITSN